MTSAVSEPLNEPRPRLAARLPFYYGWVILVVAAWAMTATLPGRTHGLGFITKPLTEDAALGVSESLFSKLNFWAVLIGSVLCLPTGRAIDRWGARRVLVVVAAVLGIACLAMSRTESQAWLFVDLTLLRGFGQGALSVVSMALVGKWFARRLEPAMGVYAVLVTIGSVAAAAIMLAAVPEHGWREAWAGVGITLLVGLALPGWFLVRNTPEALGFDIEHIRPAVGGITDDDFTLREALATPAFWAVTLGSAFFNLSWSAVTMFNESLTVELGFDRNAFDLTMKALLVAGLPANLLTGWLARRYSHTRLLAVGMLLLAAALGAFPYLSTTGHVIAYGVALGASGGIVTVVFFAAYGRMFGRSNLGVVQAVAQVVCVFASALGPVMLTETKSAIGAFRPFFLVAAPSAFILAAAAWVVAAPRRIPSSLPSRSSPPTK